MEPYLSRNYRRIPKANDLTFYRVRIEQSDLSIGTAKPRPDLAQRALTEARAQIQRTIKTCPSFLTSLVPLPDFSGETVPNWMLHAGRAAQVGPMAAVAGAVARFVGEALGEVFEDVLVENGGDVYIRSRTARVAAVYAGKSPLSNRLGIVVPPGTWGLCTSSGKIGPSYSQGRADAAAILSHDSALSDAAATALGNHVVTPDDLRPAVQQSLTVPGVLGALAVLGDQMGAGGQIELCSLEE